MKGYILTEEYNAYDQLGEYFLAWFQTKPTSKDLKRVIQNIGDDCVEHILSGGGRRKDPYWEDQWYNLREVESIN